MRRTVKEDQAWGPFIQDSGSAHRMLVESIDKSLWDFFALGVGYDDNV